MRRSARWLAGAAVALVAAACGGDAADGGISPTGPMLLVGPTASVTVSCPEQMETDTSGTCHAYGYDSYGSYTNSNVSSWSTSDTGVIQIDPSGNVTAVGTGTATITAVIDGISGSTTIKVVSPPPPLSVSFSWAETYIRPDESCTYVAEAAGGLPPYTYSWTGGTGTASDSYYFTQSSSSFTVAVTVTDAAGSTASTSVFVTVSSKAPYCAA